MFKSQKQNKNLFYFFLAVFLIACNPAFCNKTENENFDHHSQLAQADSLFRVKKFTQAYAIYEKLHGQGVSTPSMYLKMAYIKEGLGDISSAMFYLNRYYYSTFNKKALKKMELLAEEHHLSGYEYEDFEFFQNLVLKNGALINMSLIVICLFLFIMLLYKRFTANANVKGTAIALTGLVCLLIFYNNFPVIPDYAIIKSDNVLVMDKPSAGSDLITTIKKGNKLKVVQTGNAWVKVEYNERIGYVRDHNLLMIPSERI